MRSGSLKLKSLSLRDLLRPWYVAIILLTFLVNTAGPLPLAEADDFRLPAPGVMVRLSPPLDPPILKGIKVHPDNPFRFDFILDKGDSQLGEDPLKNESTKLIKYFLASLTIPEKDLWVNLSPYEKDRIIPPSFGLTEMGRDLLAEDYMLKQITASLIYPEGQTGKKFWKQIYKDAAKRFGTTNVPVNTFNKVWIVPEKAVVYENAKAGTAYVVDSRLKIMLEQDYLSLQKHEGISSPGPNQGKQTSQLGSQTIREVVLPELAKEVNEDKNFAILRQVYNSLILATWYKKKIKESVLAQIYGDKNKVAGVNIDDPMEKERIYHLYLKAFKKGVFNFIKEDVDPVTQERIPRKYFSGGCDFAQMSLPHFGISPAFRITDDEGQLPIQYASDNTVLVTENTVSAVGPEVGANQATNPQTQIPTPKIIDRPSLGENKTGKLTPGKPLKSQRAYNRDTDRKERFLKKQDVVDRFIAPGKEDFEKFKPLYDEVRSIVDRLLIAQGLNPQEFQFFLADTVEPNAYVLKYYNTIVVNLGLIRMLEEYTKAYGLSVTQDALAWVLAHEITHIMQHRREIDEGKIDEKEDLIDQHAEDRGKEYQSDLLALWLMDKSGFTVKAAPHVLRGIAHWLQAREQRSAFWGTHPQTEERLRRLEHQILTYHWQNQEVPSSVLNAVTLAYQRASFREYQEKAINMDTALNLVALLNQASNIDELLFAMLIGFEALPDSEKRSPIQVQEAFDQQIKRLAGGDQAKQVLFEYMADEVYVMLGLKPEFSEVDLSRRLAQQLPIETILKIFKLGVPNLFFISVDVDQLESTKKDKKAQDVLQRLNNRVTSMNGPSRPSDKYNAYLSGFLDGLYNRFITETGRGNVPLEFAREFLMESVNIQESVGYFRGTFLTRFLQGIASAVAQGYHSQLTAQDVRLLIKVYEILGTRVSYALNPEEVALNLYPLVSEVSLEAKRELIKWLLDENGGWKDLKAKILELDIKALFEKGQGVVFEGGKIEYLEGLLASDHVVTNMRHVLKTYIELAGSESSKVSPQELVLMHQKIFSKFKANHISDDLGIFRNIWIPARNHDIFNGYIFDTTLLSLVPEELRPMLSHLSGGSKAILYVMALGGIPNNQELRNYIFGGLNMGEKESDMQPVHNMINSLPVRQGAPETFESPDERFMYLSPEDQQKVRNLRKQIRAPMQIKPNVSDREFGMIKQILEYYRPDLGRQLSEEGSDMAKQEEAFGQYAAPVYLQALLIDLGSKDRLKERDVTYSDNVWTAFEGDISLKSFLPGGDYAKEAGNQRPKNAVRFKKGEITFGDFVHAFDFVSFLPEKFEDAVSKVIKAIPPSVFRNFVLYMLFINRVLIKETGYSHQQDLLFDLKNMHKHIAGLSSGQQARVLSALAFMVPYLGHDDLIEDSNKMVIAEYWRERYAKNAPTLDETAVRQQHDQEVASYDDMTYATPGGPVAQLYVFISRLADFEVKTAVESSEVSLASKRKIIEKYYPQSSLARDRWIKRAIQVEGQEKTVEEIEKLLAMIQNPELRDNLALGAFDQYRAQHPEEFNALSDVLTKIQRFFPKASLIRDDILSETAQFLAKTSAQYEQVRKLYLDPFKKAKDLDTKETARTAFNQDIFRTWMTNRSPMEKARFLLWFMGVEDKKPLFLVDFEYNFHINADSLREDFGRRQSQYYPLAGQSSQRQAIEPFLYGEKGIFGDEIARRGLLNRMFNFLIKEGPNKAILKKIFDKIFEKADQPRREEIFLSLVWTLSLQHGEMQNMPGINPQRQEARAIRVFLESLGLVGRQIAQVLARSLWVTKTVRDELSLVQDSAKRMDKGVVFDMLEKFGLSDQFESIEEPLGSAKIAGVYRAKIQDGRIVAIKVKRPDVDKTIEADMKFLKDVFEDLKATFIAEGIVVPDNFITQIEEGFRQELDFKQEAKNTSELGVRVQRSVLKKIKEFTLRRLAGDTRLGETQGNYEFYVPQVMEVVNNSLIIMEFIDGIKLSNERQVKNAGLNQSDIELAVANELLREVFYEGFYHGDPHLGNILVQKLKNGRVRIILIDAGASFSIDLVNRRMLGKLMMAVRDNQGDVLQGIVRQLGGTVNDDMRRDINNEVLESKESVGQKLLWFFHILEKNHVQMPNELLQIMRFFATGQALFNRGDSAMVNEEEKERAVDLDRAISQASSGVTRRGGIDLTASQMPLEIKNAGEGIRFYLDPAMLKQLQNAPGFVPVIINIQPLKDLRQFLSAPSA